MRKGRATLRTIAVDFDATLAAYHEYKGPTHIGKPIKGAQQFLQALKTRKYRIVIFSCRATECGGLEAMKKWMSRHKMPYDEIYTRAGKPHASAYVDDRGVTCRPQEDPDAYETALEWVDYLCH